MSLAHERLLLSASESCALLLIMTCQRILCNFREALEIRRQAREPQAKVPSEVQANRAHPIHTLLCGTIPQLRTGKCHSLVNTKTSVFGIQTPITLSSCLCCLQDSRKAAGCQFQQVTRLPSANISWPDVSPENSQAFGGVRDVGERDVVGRQKPSLLV